MSISYQSSKCTIFESFLYRTNAAVIDGSDYLLLVDPNWLPHEIEAIRLVVAERLGQRSLYILFTHSDFDHILGYKAFPEAKVIASQAFRDNSQAAAIVQQIKDWDDQHYIQRSYPIEYPKVDICIEKSGQVVEIGANKLQFFLAPGHTADGLFCWIAAEQLLIVGDYLSNIEFPFIYDSFQSYQITLDLAKRLSEQLPIALTITGHGDICFGKEELKRRIHQDQSYLYKLLNLVEKGEAFDLEKLLQQYPFPKGLVQSHIDNIALLKKEKGLPL